MEDLLYWIIEYVKVLFGYGFIMFIWPSVVFRKYLRGKSVTFRFGFCTTVQVALVSTVVLMLGLVHILNRCTMWIFFYGLFIWSFREKFKITDNTKKKFKYLVTGTFGWKHLVLLTWEGIVRFVKRMLRVFWKFYKVHWLEYTLLVVTVVYAMIYFSWGAFQENSYGFSDIVVHHEWIYGLALGKPFSAGIYPEGMHCMVYALHALFGIRIYSCLLFIGCVNLIAIILSIYCLAKEIFKWRYSAVFTLIVLFTINMTSMNQITAMARLQCALPQEFGFPALYVCAVFLIRYLKQKNYVVWNEKRSKMCWDENLFVFCIALSATIIVHFYTTIMAFYLCLGIAFIYLKRIFSKERFLPLVVAVISGVVIAATPMVVGFISGIPLQGSLYWGMSIIQGGSNEENSEREEIVPEIEENNVNISEEIYTPMEQIPVNTVEGMSEQTSEVQKKPGIVEKLVNMGEKISGLIKEKCTTLYRSGYVVLLQEYRSKLIVGLSILLMLLWGICKIIGAVLSRVLKWKSLDKDFFDGYAMMVISTTIFVCAHAANLLGLPSLIEGSRTCFIGYSLIAMVYIMVIDMLFVGLEQIFTGVFLHFMSFIVPVIIFLVIYQTENYHGYLYYELSRFEAAVNVTNDIIESLPENTYTIVSPTDELYQVIEFGRHEEWLTFLQNQGRIQYTLPTEYIFLFVEKKPLEYVQDHFFSGPKWLASNKYSAGVSLGSTYPEYRTSDISDEYANRNIMYFGNLSGTYTDLESRTIIESKAYRWCMRFMELYPNEMQVFYEDEKFVCYYFRQNTHKLYDLAIYE